MFGLGDDLDIDESFLDEVLEVEKASARNSNVIDHDVLRLAQISPVFDDSPSVEVRSRANLRDTLSTPLSAGRSKSGGGRKVQSGNGRTRKFPGPAGLLPQRQSNSSLVATEDFLNEIEQELKTEALPPEKERPCPDGGGGIGEESSAWAELMEDLGAEGKALVRQVNVASVSQRAKQSRALKVPFLALLIQGVDTSAPDPCLYLSDPSGEMVGAVHRQVWEELGEELVPGSAVVLLNVGVVCTGHTSTRHYLSITSNNIAALYSPTKGSEIKIRNVKSLERNDYSKFLGTWRQLLLSSAHDSPHQSLSTDKQLFSTASFSSPSFSTPSFSPVSSSSQRRPSLSNRPHLSSNRFNVSSNNHLSPINSRVQTTSAPFDFPSKRHQLSNTSDTVKFPVKSGVPCPSKQIRLDHGLVRPSSVNTANETVESLLDGIDTDSLFGDF